MKRSLEVFSNRVSRWRGWGKIRLRWRGATRFLGWGNRSISISSYPLGRRSPEFRPPSARSGNVEGGR
ncbi:hypothetical protein B9R42_17385 [Arthrospira platensis PCC 7345]